MRSTLSIIVLIFFIPYFATGQQKFSFKFQTPNSRSNSQLQLVSVSVKDANSFISVYKTQIVIQACHPASRTFHVMATRDWILKNFTDDSNIIFVDLLRSAYTESVNESANPAFNRVNMLHRYFPELNGEGQRVSIKEQQFVTDDIDLINRSFSTSVSPIEISRHATAMATFIAGAGNSAEKGRGVVDKATITSSDFNRLLPDPDSIFTNRNIQLQNHSYGIGIENYYGNEAAAYDQQTFDFPEVLHVFSAGNIGKENPSSGNYQGLNYANLSGNFKQAKNVLVISAVNESLQIPLDNSRGPAFDGRIKPELVAFGAGGTSDAAAMVTGIAAAIQQQYLNVFGVHPPSSAVKAILIASADDIGKKGIDYSSGYGGVNAFKAAKLVENQFVQLLELENNEEATVSLNVPAGTVELKVAIVWTDPPAQANAQNVLVHDIDARISDGVNSYMPWKLKTAANIDSLQADAFTGDDNMNNVEFITVANPSPGTYSVILKTPTLSTSSQIVSVAYWLESEGFSWNYPVSTDVMEAGTAEYIFWNTSFEVTGELWIKLNQGAWNLVEESVSLSAPLHWNIPDTLAVAQLKMVVQNADYVSEEFVISPRPVLKVPFNCPNEFALSWHGIKGADNYDLLSLGDEAMSSFVTANDTLQIIPSPTTRRYFSVVPQVKERRGLQSFAIDYSAQGASCYINLFTAIRYDVESVKLQLQLSTLYKVDEVAVYRLLDQTRDLIATTSPDNAELEWFDQQLISSGVMRYQADVTLNNGSHILSDIAEVNIQEKHTAVVYPNPLFDGMDLNVLSDGTGQRFRLVDGTGKILKETELQYMQESVTLDALAPGLYFYQLVDGERVIDTGKLVKL